jgi:hypothetical protein
MIDARGTRGPVFILSLDCEGKWGSAGWADPRHRTCLTGANLLRAYREILGLLERREIPATFAFVMAYTLSEEEFRSRPDLFREGGRRTEAWLARFRAEAAGGRLDGWFLPEALEAVRAAGRHEIACHGFTHLPLDEGRVTREEARRELGSAVRVAREKGVALETIVYPENVVGYVGLLPEHGLRGYRDRLARPASVLGRSGALLDELRLRTRAQTPARPRSARAVAIPPGYFLNWRARMRRAVPARITLARWRHIVGDAVRHGRVAHLWLHPHNVIDGRGTLQLLDRILQVVSAHRRRGELQVLTQADYVGSWRDVRRDREGSIE